MASKMYGSLIAKAFNKEVNWSADTIKVALVSSSYTPNQDTHDYWDDVVANEIAAGGGYTTGGLTLSGKTVTYDSANNVLVLDANDAIWSNASFTARYAVLYDDSGATNAQKALIGYVDFTSEQSSTNAAFTVTWDATGIARFTVA